MARKISLLMVMLMVVMMIAPAAQAQDETFSLTILHTNDVHGAYGPYNAAADATTDGGAARQMTVVNQIRAEGGNVLLLDAGDRFTGTLFHQQWRGEDSARIMNAMGYDAMTVGNHEFDDGDEALVSFTDSLNFPLLTANVTFGADLAEKIQPYAVLEVAGEQIGVVGLTPPDTGILSSPGEDVVFNEDMAGAVQSYVDELTEQGINKIILMSHIGQGADETIVAQVSGVDIIIGGHSHTLLSNAYSAGEAEYPVVMQDKDGNNVYIVQAGSNLRYMGRLNVTWDTEGVVASASGDTILLSRYITPDPEILAIVNELRVPITELRETAVGDTSVFLVGDRAICRAAECNLGNLITDAMRAYSGAPIAITNGGGIRSSVPVGAATPEILELGSPLTVTLGDVLTVLPFGNLVATVDLTGADVIAALENGVSQVENGAGRFPQVSGIRYSWDGSKEAGQRVVSVEVMGEDGSYSAIDPESVYTVATNDFMRRGGDGYSTFVDNAISFYDFGSPLDVVLADFIKANSPISPAVEGRITRIDTP
ncbi:MAG: 5'-nucleotidase C-terminal domain-containing protein [Anaerolineae bacterium]|nr:5'-nucleotidase C-terminal domain-containing protein [Anaerolineae bacterium]